jgi:hypothetical protein
MKHKTKKLIAISLSLLTVASLFIWYFFPVFVAKWLLYNNADLQRYLNVSPTYSDKLPESPAEWDRISIDTLSLKLPISKYKRISGKETYLNLVSDQGSLTIFDLAPSAEALKMIKEKKLKYPFVSYEDTLAIVKSLPADISFLNAREKNKRSSANLILKAIGIPTGGLGEVRIVNTEILKAICIISEKGERGFSAVVDLYSQNENMTFTILLTHYKDKTEMSSDILNILGGIRLPNQPLDIETVKKDIDTIVKKYKTSEQLN